MRTTALLALMPIALATASCGSGGDAANEPEATKAADPAADTAAAPAAATDETTRPASFAMCASCHQVEPGKHGVGPSLAGVFGAKAGHAQGYAYSAAMNGSGLTWDEATLDKYLAAPMQTIPGTKMTYAGLKDAAQRKEMIEYLKGL